MLLGEPGPTAFDLHFSLGRIPVRVSPWFWLMALCFSARFEPINALISVAMIFVSILVHEMGHALVVLSNGWRPWIVLHGMGGLCIFQPVRMHPMTHISISAAGPMAGFILAGLLAALVTASGYSVVADLLIAEVELGSGPSLVTFNDSLAVAVGSLLFFNVVWGLVNLFPVYPLDGGQIARELFGMLRPRDGLRQSLWLSVFTGAALAAYAITQIQSPYMAIFFGFLAFQSYAALQNWGGGYGGRGW